MKQLLFTFLLFISYVFFSCSSNNSENSGSGNNNTTYSYTQGPVLQYGNYSYQTIITSCNQTWMKKNLEAIKYKNGDPIQQVSDPTAWARLTTGAYCEYTDSNGIYGKLYNWYAVNDPRGLAPNGWHIPTKQELENYMNCLGGYLIAGEKMREAGTYHWNDLNTGNNISGFTAYGGGLRSHSTGNFVNIMNYGIWWTSTEYSTDTAYACRLISNSKYVYYDKISKKSGYSIRCIKN